MMRIHLVLLLAVLVSAVYLVQMQYQSRRLFVEVEKAQALSRKLQVEREKLELDQRAHASPMRIEKLAKENLQMRPATPAVTIYVKRPTNQPANRTSGVAP